MDDSYLGRSPAMLVLQELRRTFDQEPTFWTGPPATCATGSSELSWSRSRRGDGRRRRQLRNCSRDRNGPGKSAI